MKVLHVIPGLGQGGAEAILNELVGQNFRKSEHVVVSLTGHGFYEERLCQKGVVVHHCRVGKSGVVGAIRSLIRLIRVENPDVVQTWLYYGDLFGGLAAKFAGVRHIVWGVHNSALNPFRVGFRNTISALICAAISRWVPTQIVYCSASARLCHERIGYATQKASVIHNGYDTSVFTPTRRVAFNGSQSVVIGMVARWDPLKDHSTFFSALRLIDDLDVKVLLIGTGMVPEHLRVVRSLARFGISERVSLLGPRSDMPNLYGSLDIHVLSSYSESFPNVVAEAMACGVPCVSTDVGDVKLLIGSTGWVCPKSSPKALADVLRRAICSVNGADWATRKNLCRERVKTYFSIERMVAGYNQVWCGPSES